MTCSLTVGSGGRSSGGHVSCGKGPGLEDGGCPGVYMGERVLTWVSFLLGEGLEISNLDPLTLLGTSNRQLNISKERQKPDSLGGEGPWGWSPKGLALLAQPPHTFSNLSAAQRPGNARNLLHSLLSPSLGPSGCWDFSSGNRILREECTDLKGTPLPHSHPPQLA